MPPGPLAPTLVHERFTEYAGSEKVVAALAALWPSARVLAPIADPAALGPTLAGRVEPGRLTPYARGGTYAHLLPLLPAAMRRLSVGPCDLVVASHHAFANQVVFATDAPVLSYVHTPARWVWEPSTRRGEVGGLLGAAGLTAYAAAYRRADRAAAQRVHTLVANSSAVAERIRVWWGREATVVHPPVDTDFYRPDPSVPREDFFLVAGRLVPYKRPDLAVRAATAADVRLVVAGTGRAERLCRELAGASVTFLGRVDDATQRDLYRRCRALLLPGIEDFGIVPVEAQACGAPVLAARGGGALDVVRPGTGELVDTPDRPARAVTAWQRALRDVADHDPAVVRRNAERFSTAAFGERMRAVAAEVTTAGRHGSRAPG